MPALSLVLKASKISVPEQEGCSSVSEATQIIFEDEEPLRGCLTERRVHKDRLLKIEELRPEILNAGDEAQQLRRLPNDIVERLIDEGFFRFAIPEDLGGENASSMETVEILEHMAAIDASVAWNGMLGSEINAMAAGGMDPKLAQEV